MLSRVEILIVRVSQWFFHFLYWTGMFIVFSLFFNIRVEGKENIPKKGRLIFAANHQNFFDGFFIAYLEGPLKKSTYVIAKRALNNFFQILFKLIGAVLLGSSREDYQNLLKKLNNVLHHGGRVVIFPEGDISSREIPKRFKGGVIRLSNSSRTRILPIYINGSYNIRFFWYWFRRSEILIRVGKPIELYKYADSSEYNSENLAAILRNEVLKLSNCVLESFEIQEKYAIICN